MHAAHVLHVIVTRTAVGTQLRRHCARRLTVHAAELDSAIFLAGPGSAKFCPGRH
jgi:hypothetical protein